MHYLGSIVATTTLTKDNGNTADDFVIPASAGELLLQCDVADVFVGLVADSGDALATASALKLTTALERVSLPLLARAQTPFVLALNNPTGSTATLKVFRVK